MRAGIAYALTEAMDEGHCGLPAEELISLTQTLLEVPTELVDTALGLELEGGAVIADDLEGRRCVFLAGLYRAEREIAEKLKALAIGRPPWPAIDADKAIHWVEQRTKLVLADCRLASLAAIVEACITVFGRIDVLHNNVGRLPSVLRKPILWLQRAYRHYIQSWVTRILRPRA